MARTPTDPDKKMLKFAVNLMPDQYAFLEELTKSLDVAYMGDAVRELVKGHQTWFGLPEYQVRRLKQDMASRKQNWVTYLQELLARRYEEVAAQDRSPAKRK